MTFEPPEVSGLNYEVFPVLARTESAERCVSVRFLQPHKVMTDTHHPLSHASPKTIKHSKNITVISRARSFSGPNKQTSRGQV